MEKGIPTFSRSEVWGRTPDWNEVCLQRVVTWLVEERVFLILLNVTLEPLERAGGLHTFMRTVNIHPNLHWSIDCKLKFF